MPPTRATARRRTPPRLAAALTATALLAAAGCGGEEEPPPRAAPGPVTVAVAGDVHFAGASAAAAEPGGLDAIAGVLGDADVTVVNLETAITDRGTPAAKQYVFRAPARALGALRAAGVDVAGLANNHALDYGRQGLTDTLAAGREQGLPLIGAGEDAAAAFQPFTTTVRGHRLAVLDATQVLDTSLAGAWTATDDQPGLAAVRDDAGRERLLGAVRAARAGADSVVVLLHWGKELEECPSPAQRDLAGALVAAGADAVVGSHAHRLLGGGWLAAGGRRGYVDYGLGNFVFYAKKGVTTATGVLRLTLPGGGGVGEARWSPARIRGGVPVPLEGADAEEALAAKDALRPCTDLEGAARP
ncbi:CapA family protein [Kineococcus sp. SYSU DK005]|uniref:CapA family protein n=1 Tax=Kineococcus sp. SYSU DK005 TaxID=3383126 RepID=UPI003D7C5ADE